MSEDATLSIFTHKKIDPKRSFAAQKFLVFNFAKTVLAL